MTMLTNNDADDDDDNDYNNKTTRDELKRCTSNNCTATVKTLRLHRHCVVHSKHSASANSRQSVIAISAIFNIGG